MPFEDAKTYRFNPFDLTKVWPHGDYPLHRGRQDDAEPQRHRLPRRDRAGRVRAEQHRARAPVCRPDKMLLARGFSYADAHRARLGVNYKQIPVNAPKVEVHAYSKDGAMRMHNATDPVYAPNSYGGPQADPSRVAEARWVRRRRDGPRGLHAAPRRRRLGPGRHAGPRGARRRRPGPPRATTSSATCSKGVQEPVLSRVFEYWRNVDKDLGDRIEQGVRSQRSGTPEQPRQS